MGRFVDHRIGVPWREEFRHRMVVEHGERFADEAMVFLDEDIALCGEPVTEEDREFLDIVIPATVVSTRRHARRSDAQSPVDHPGVPDPRCSGDR